MEAWNICLAPWSCRAKKRSFVTGGHYTAQEKQAFEAAIDFLHDRWRRYPDLHVYHYAAYEMTALKRLAAKNATRELELDDFLRAGVFVDLYTVVRQGLIVGTPGYSLKDIERLNLPPRDGDVTTAMGSVVAYQKWMDSGEPQNWQESTILRDIRDYNRVDRESLTRMCGWLRGVQNEWAIPYVPHSITDLDDSSLRNRLTSHRRRMHSWQPQCGKNWKLVACQKTC